MSLSIAILQGNCGRDPEVKHLESGKTVASFTLATSRRDKKTDWHNIVAWDKLAEFTGKFIKKGSAIIVTGEIQYRSYEDKQGVTKYITEIVANRIDFAGGKKEEKDQEPQEEKWQGKGGKVTTGSMSNINDLPGAVDDDLPY
jgi:single-strand DNA-binding protein